MEYFVEIQVTHNEQQITVNKNKIRKHLIPEICFASKM